MHQINIAIVLHFKQKSLGQNEEMKAQKHRLRIKVEIQHRKKMVRIPTKNSSNVISKDWTSFALVAERRHQACFKEDTSHKDNNNWMIMFDKGD